MKALYKEKLLVLQVQRDASQDAYGELYDLYIERIYRFIAIKVSERHTAEDLTSDVFLKTWNYLTQDSKGREEAIKSFSGLIYRIARTTLVDFYRSKAKNQELPLETIEDMGDSSRVIENIHISQEAQAILSMVKNLKREYQEVILLKYIEELSTAEIAEILGKKKTNVRVTLHRAMNMLKSMLDIDKKA